MNKDDVRSDTNSYCISLVKLIGKKIVDIDGYVTSEFGEPSFKVSWLKLEDGTEMSFEGEHDLPYLVELGTKQPNFDIETLDSLRDD